MYATRHSPKTGSEFGSNRLLATGVILEDLLTAP
jgi:hypothetical protein